MQRLVKILLAGIAIMALSLTACGSDGGNTATAKQRACSVVLKDLEKAKAKETKQAGTPAEADAAKAVKALKKELKSCDDGSKTKDSTTTSAATTSDGDVTVKVDTGSLKTLFDGEVKSSELAFGSEADQLQKDAPQERGVNAHSDHTLNSPEELTAWLKGSDPKAKPVANRVFSAIATTCGAEDVGVHFNRSQGWLHMVVKPPSQIWGTSYDVGGQMMFAQDWRTTGVDDGYWVPVCTQGSNKGKVVADGLVRADCGNGSNKPKIRIIRPGTPVAPPVEAPPKPSCPPKWPHGYWDGKTHKWVCKEGPGADPTQSGNHPKGGTGPETGGSDEGGPKQPASRPPGSYTPPEPPAATPVPETTTTRPSVPVVTAPPPPPTTAPPNDDPEVTAPPVKGDTGTGGF